MTEQAASVGYGLAWRGVRALPEPAARALFTAGAELAARRAGAGAWQLRRNLARVVPRAQSTELDQLVAAGLRSYARYWCEAFRLPSMDLGEVARGFDAGLSGASYLDTALERGNGAIVALTHSGNWDAAGVWLAQRHGSFTTVVEQLRPDSLYRRFCAYRRSLGFEILPMDGGRDTAMTLLARLRANRVVCLVADRDLSSTGIPVSMFGEEARLPAGPARLAARTGAALLPGSCWFTERGWGFRLHPPIAVPGGAAVTSATQELAGTFAADIAAHPSDWHMLQRVFLADLSPLAAEVAG